MVIPLDREESSRFCLYKIILVFIPTNYLNNTQSYEEHVEGINIYFSEIVVNVIKNEMIFQNISIRTTSKWQPQSEDEGHSILLHQQIIVCMVVD